MQFVLLNSLSFFSAISLNLPDPSAFRTAGFPARVEDLPWPALRFWWCSDYKFHIATRFQYDAEIETQRALKAPAWSTVKKCATQSKGATSSVLLGTPLPAQYHPPESHCFAFCPAQCLFRWWIQALWQPSQPPKPVRSFLCYRPT